MHFKNFIYGLIIGVGFIIPGVSGGVLAAILGIYEEVLNRIINIKNNFKENISYLLPIIFGITLSVLLFSKLILYLLNKRVFFISYVFMGLILGCIPFLIKTIKNKTNKKANYLLIFTSFIFGMFLFYLENNYLCSNTNINTFTMIIGGFIYSIGKIVPGISGAALLMIIGIYEYLLNILANPFNINLNTIINLIPFILSFIISSYFIIKLINYLLNKHFRNTYSVIIGFVLSSIIFLYPNSFSFTSIIILISSFLISYNLSN